MSKNGAFDALWSMYTERQNGTYISILSCLECAKKKSRISLHDGTLTISGEREDETSSGEGNARTERYVGKFRRSVTLPTRVDITKVNAGYKDGILTVSLPKAEEAKPKQIKVNVD